MMSMRIYPDELAHFGIKGMKWGIRRFENEDGTLTEAGKLRYYKGNRIGGTSLTSEGYKRNKNQKLKRYEDSVAYNVQKVDKTFGPNLEAYRKAQKSGDSAKQKQLSASLRKSITKAAKEHPLYSKEFSRLSETKEGFEKTKYGKAVVDNLMTQLEWNYDHFRDDK